MHCCILSSWPWRGHEFTIHRKDRRHNVRSYYLKIWVWVSAEVKNEFLLKQSLSLGYVTRTFISVRFSATSRHRFNRQIRVVRSRLDSRSDRLLPLPLPPLPSGVSYSRSGELAFWNNTTLLTHDGRLADNCVKLCLFSSTRHDSIIHKATSYFQLVRLNNRADDCLILQ